MIYLVVLYGRYWSNDHKKFVSEPGLASVYKRKTYAEKVAREADEHATVVSMTNNDWRTALGFVPFSFMLDMGGG